MTDKTQGVEEKLVSMLDALEKGAVQVGDAVVKYSPDVAEATLAVVQIDAAGKLIIGTLCTIAAYVAYRVARWGIKEFVNDMVGAEDGLIAPSIVFGVLFFVPPFIGAIIYLADIWNWVAIFEPKLYLAKQIIKAALGA
jgi:hypothetical protein